MVRKYVYFFGPDGTDGDGAMRDLLGGKGADLAEMTRLGIPVPPGFTITTEACIEYFTNNQQYPPGIWEQLEEHLAKKGYGSQIRSERPSPLSLCPLWRTGIYARDDGYSAKFRS